MEEEVVLPIELDDTALVEALIPFGGMGRVEGVVVRAPRSEPGQGDCPFPAAAPVEPAILSADEKRPVVLDGVRIVPAGPAEIVELGPGARGPDRERQDRRGARREAEAGGEADVAIAVLFGVPGVGGRGRGEAGRPLVEEAERIFGLRPGAGERDVGGEGAERIGRRGQREPGPAAAGPGDDVDDAAERVRAVEQALRAAEDLDPVDLAERKVGHIVRARRVDRVVELEPVEKEERVLAVGAAHGHRGGRARPAVPDRGEAENGFEGLEDEGLARAEELLARDHGDRAAHLLLGGFEPGGGDDEVVFDGRRRLVLRARGEGRQRHERGERCEGDSSRGHGRSSAAAPAAFSFSVFRPKTGRPRLKEGLLTPGSSSSRAFQPHGRGVSRDSSPVTVAGAVSASDGLPFGISRGEL